MFKTNSEMYLLNCIFVISVHSQEHPVLIIYICECYAISCLWSGHNRRLAHFTFNTLRQRKGTGKDEQGTLCICHLFDLSNAVHLFDLF